MATHPKDKTNGKAKSPEAQAALIKYLAEHDPQLHEQLAVEHKDEKIHEQADEDKVQHYAKICSTNGWNLKDLQNNERFTELVDIGLYTKQKILGPARKKLTEAQGPPKGAQAKRGSEKYDFLGFYDKVIWFPNG